MASTCLKLVVNLNHVVVLKVSKKYLLKPQSCGKSQPFGKPRSCGMPDKPGQFRVNIPQCWHVQHALCRLQVKQMLKVDRKKHYKMTKCKTVQITSQHVLSSSLKELLPFLEVLLPSCLSKSLLASYTPESETSRDVANLTICCLLK
jgi:hypothetical protein